MYVTDIARSNRSAVAENQNEGSSVLHWFSTVGVFFGCNDRAVGITKWVYGALATKLQCND
jgi:hypothetical protein